LDVVSDDLDAEAEICPDKPSRLATGESPIAWNWVTRSSAASNGTVNPFPMSLSLVATAGPAAESPVTGADVETTSPFVERSNEAREPGAGAEPEACFEFKTGRGDSPVISESPFVSMCVPSESRESAGTIKVVPDPLGSVATAVAAAASAVTGLEVATTSPLVGRFNEARKSEAGAEGEACSEFNLEFRDPLEGLFREAPGISL